jgi:segregation and condensation protein B
MNTLDAKRVLETALLCAAQPLSVRELRQLFNDELGADTLKTLLQDIQDDWKQRGIGASCQRLAYAKSSRNARLP